MLRGRSEVAIAAHAVISQLMYGGFGINIHAPVDPHTYGTVPGADR